MITKYTKKILILFVISVISFSCKHKQNDEVFGIEKENNFSYTKVEMYTWCYDLPIGNNDNSGTFVGNCNAHFYGRPKDFFYPENLVYSSSNPDTIQLLKKLIFEKRDSVTNFDVPKSEFRFLILFRKENFDADTILFKPGYNNSTIYYNNKFRFVYPYTINDSIELIWNSRKVHCFY